MKPLALPKNQRLCSSKAIDALFSKGHSAIAYPLRAVYHLQPANPGEPQARFMITVPKKKIRHAVGRVLMRRRIREAYRLNRHRLFPTLEASGKTADIALVYLSNQPADFATISTCLCQLLDKMANDAQRS
jgi:ribonuclease P protein component